MVLWLTLSVKEEINRWLSTFARYLRVLFELIRIFTVLKNRFGPEIRNRCDEDYEIQVRLFVWFVVFGNSRDEAREV